jgi:hypothetical protein
MWGAGVPPASSIMVGAMSIAGAVGSMGRSYRAAPRPVSPGGARRSSSSTYESAFPWLVGMSDKAVRTDRHKLNHWIHKDGVDELNDLEQSPYEMTNSIGNPAHVETVKRLRRELRTLVADAVGL